MIDRTLSYVLGHNDFKTLGTSRTDALVSAVHSGFQLYLHEPVKENEFIGNFNENLPNDIRAIKIRRVDSSFNIIQTPKIKEYVYLFHDGEKAHPFCAPFMAYFPGELNLEHMKKGAQMLRGPHHFINYTTKPSALSNFDRIILDAEIRENDLFNGNFFPEKSHLFHVKSAGFLRHQVRLMMGQLVQVGLNNISLEDFSISLDEKLAAPFDYIAPASGLILWKIDFGL
ncbi:tRNA pseudouridine(38-40) synthase TruA [Fulvivirga sedimenti]|uniref:tRNA pseudouridine synthase n=1 Tax=Fulvivirga sedimenti TaxID=2879465 RepID=A0A9X1HXX9_9BACT|nr:tRNA pseudouridine(38-40) synthase TruA [Fulvivirga sedimenti]MCA6078532.1 tRNA pseudouridine(38-40) synthase TruA [Fulvivirga sedimenti]